MTTLILISFIISNAVAIGEKTAIFYSRSSLITYFLGALLLYNITDWFFFEKSISLYNGLIYCNINTIVFITFIFLLSFCILILTSSYAMNKISNVKVSLKTNEQLIPTSNVESFTLTLKDVFQADRDHFKIIEYSLITQFIIIGGILLLSSNDLITLFLSIELQSYGLYILSTIYRNSESSTSAGLTYFLLGGLSSCIILLGLSFLYINTGTTSLDAIYLMYNIMTCNDNLLSIFLLQHSESFNPIITQNAIFSLNHYEYVIQFSLVILTVGFLFKISAAPFHSWSPGVYDAIPTVTTTFVAIIPKISILILLFDLVYSTWHTTYSYSWTSILLFSCFLSFVIGSVLGLTQFRIKRLYAYSTISHVGFILLALSIHSVESTQAFFFYIIQYSLSNLNAFFILVAIGYTYVNFQKKTIHYNASVKSIFSLYKVYKNKISELSPIEYVDNLKGYFYLNPIIAISLAITLYSFIGVPPLVGFFAKQMVLSSALDNGDIFISLIAILTSVISAVYYLYIIKHMFFEKSEYTPNNISQSTVISKTNVDYNTVSHNDSRITISSWLTILISILTLTISLFIFLYSEIYFLMSIISIILIY